jgi:hypothetical protein
MNSLNNSFRIFILYYMFISRVSLCNIIVFSLRKNHWFNYKKKSLNSGNSPSISKEEQTRFSKAKKLTIIQIIDIFPKTTLNFRDNITHHSVCSRKLTNPKCEINWTFLKTKRQPTVHKKSFFFFFLDLG